MSRTYDIDVRAEQRYRPALKLVIGSWCRKIEDATEHLDQHQAADLVGDGHHYALRVRDASFLPRYPWDFTLRYARNNGTVTEHSKVLRGFGDYMIYGYGKDGEIVHWWQVSFVAYRAACRTADFRSFVDIIPNADDETWFVAVHLDKAAALGHPLVLRAHERLSRAKFPTLFVAM